MKGETEAGFMATVVAVAHQHGWKVMHIRAVQKRDGTWETPIQYDGEGWPDLFMTRQKTGHVITAELKVGNNKETDEQSAWLQALECCGVPAFTWWPTDWEEIETVLREGAATRWRIEVERLEELVQQLTQAACGVSAETGRGACDVDLRGSWLLVLGVESGL